MVIRIIMECPEETKYDLMERVRFEIMDAKPHCFTRKVNSLVSVLVGIVDGVAVTISKREEVQINIENIIKKLMAEKITYVEAKAEMTLLFADVTEDDNITDDFKQSNLSALEDYRPDDMPDLEAQKKAEEDLLGFNEKFEEYKNSVLTPKEDIFEVDGTIDEHTTNTVDY